jgi:hypothetical protein
MVNVGQILKRSWQILWNYRILWIFGVLLALFAGGRGGGNGGGSNSSIRNNNPGDFSGNLPDNAPAWLRELGQWFAHNVQPLFAHPEQHVSTFVLIFVAIFLFVLVCSLIAALVRYPAETAVVRMVDEYEQTGQKMGFRQGWKLGWSRRAFRLWVIDVLTGIPVFLIALLIGGVAVLFFVGVNPSGSLPVGELAIVAAIGLAFLGIFLLIVVGVVLGLLRHFFMRKAALEGTGVIDSIKQGWQMFWRNWKSAGLMWLVMIGIGIGFGILSFIAFFLLIPIYLILLIPAGIVAAVPGLIVWGITGLFASGPLAWIVGILVALPFFFLVLFAPLTVLEGLYMVYESNVWTLTYREIKSLENRTSAGSQLPPQEPASFPAPDDTPVA